MSDSHKSKDRIPFESLSDNQAVASWRLPEVGTRKVVRSAKRENDDGAQPKETIETVSAKKKPRHLTAEQLQAITEEARKEGFQQGLSEGTEKGLEDGKKRGEQLGKQQAYAEAKKDIEALQHRLRQISSRLLDPMQAQEAQLENMLVDIALGLSREVIAREIKLDPHIIMDIVQRTLSAIPKGAENIEVFLNDDDAAMLEALVPEQQRRWQISRDNKLSSGGVRVETKNSLADFSVEQRLQTYIEKQNASEELPQNPLPDYHRSDDAGDTTGSAQPAETTPDTAADTTAEQIRKDDVDT